MTAFPTRPVEDIREGMRHRVDYGDLAALAHSIDEHGLLQPVVIRPDGTLIAGARRLRAWSLTKYREQPIPVREIDLDAIVRGEAAENFARKDFTPSEAVAIKRALEPELRAEARARQAAAGPASGAGAKSASAKLAEVVKGETRQQVAALAGMKPTTLAKAEAVVEAAEAEPEKYAGLVVDMDRTGRVDGPFKRLQVRRQGEALRKAPPPLPMRGPYGVLVVDFPWPFEADDDRPAERGRAMRPYASMSIAEGSTLPVASMLAPDAVVWMWTTNFHMRHAFTLLDGWGLQATPTILTWVKDRMGRGQVLRDKTEHAIVATRGKPTIVLTNETTELRGPRREHSRKPDEFYALVERLCPAPIYAELFSRGDHGSLWDCHGDQIGTFAAVVADDDGAAK